MNKWILAAIFFIIGFLIAWLIGKVLASREFDMLQRFEEERHQELINHFNQVIEDMQPDEDEK